MLLFWFFSDNIIDFEHDIFLFMYFQSSSDKRWYCISHSYYCQLDNSFNLEKSRSQPSLLIIIIRSDKSIKWWLDNCELTINSDYQSHSANLTVLITTIAKTISNVSLTACIQASDSDS